MLLGYNTNGLAHHRLSDALRLMADEGFKSAAITLDAAALDPYEEPATLARQTTAIRDLLDSLGLERVVETGARFLLNPRMKHDPTLMDPDPVKRALRVDFLRRAIDLAAALDAGAVSFWSGILRDGSSEEAAMDRLATALRPVIEHAEAKGVRLAFEPEPGMFIDTFDRFARLDERVSHPLFDLTVDVGHVHCNERGPVAEHINSWGPRIANVHIEDMVEGVHEHLMFGEGTMDFPPIIAALREVGYRGGLHVELSRHSHMGDEALRRSREFLAPLLRD
ncbi:sugar phosphate isomerase/epimerase family protein [Paludisphaera rhizosphaerae]|uniref:sugar phosphate isomerase/epimerase family protein n=1 Tax=Paludisphaera rhizosphaerae TaxID=2711216 RepID=UPI0013EB1654|nr:sugar phosphate isomerase/epimerase family protein [Paludisphaera rhizosphaerae]